MIRSSVKSDKHITSLSFHFVLSQSFSGFCIVSQMQFKHLKLLFSSFSPHMNYKVQAGLQAVPVVSQWPIKQ